MIKLVLGCLCTLFFMEQVFPELDGFRHFLVYALLVTAIVLISEGWSDMRREHEAKKKRK